MKRLFLLFLVAVMLTGCTSVVNVPNSSLPSLNSGMEEVPYPSLAADVPLSAEISQSIPLIQADQVHHRGITGQGVGVMVIDHFSGSIAQDTHGRWVTGILRAVAPGARIWYYDLERLEALRFQSTYWRQYSAVELALLFTHIFKDIFRIKVVNMSFAEVDPQTERVIPYYSPCSANSWGDELRQLVEAGVTLIAASGNEYWPGAIASPACHPEVISVGAVYDTFSPSEGSPCPEETPQADRITCYSNSAYFLDLLAPGSRIQVPGSRMEMGTSAAAPHVAGVAALMLQLNPYLSPEQIRDILKRTGVPVKDSRNGVTFSRVDALNAVEMAQNLMWQ